MTAFHIVAPNVCGSSARNLLYVFILAARILWWLMDFWKICGRKNMFMKHINFVFQQNAGVKAESPDEDSCDTVMKEDSHDEDSGDKVESSGSCSKFRDILPPGEQENTSQSEKIVILCNVDAFGNGLAALKSPFSKDASRKEDKKRRRGQIRKATRKAHLRRLVRNRKNISPAAPTPTPKPQPPPPVSSLLKDEEEKDEDDDDDDDDDDSLAEDKPPFICKICSKSFSKRDNLKKHEIIHRGEKPYLCEECGKSFARKQDLNVHRRYHSGIRPYACSLCDKTFHSYSGLKSHENRHNGIKPFLCNACGKTFVQKSQLTNHERVHTQVSILACAVWEQG